MEEKIATANDSELRLLTIALLLAVLALAGVVVWITQRFLSHLQKQAQDEREERKQNREEDREERKRDRETSYSDRETARNILINETRASADSIRSELRDKLDPVERRLLQLESESRGRGK